MATTVYNVFDDVQRTLLDVPATPGQGDGGSRWTAAQLLQYFNSGQRDIAVRVEALRTTPAYVRNVVTTLAAGSRQDIPSDGLRILEIMRNMGRTWVTGTTYTTNQSVYESSTRYVCLVGHTAGTFATDLTSAYWVASELMEELSTIEQMEYNNLVTLKPNFMEVDANDSATVEIWTPNTNDRTSYFVYPRQPIAENSTNAFQHVDIKYSAIPAEAATVAGSMTLRDEYREALHDYMVYRAFSIDDDVTPEGLSKATVWKQTYVSNPIFGI